MVITGGPAGFRPVLSVDVPLGEIEVMIAGGVGPELPRGARCPGCGGLLRPWTRKGYLRWVRRNDVTSRIALRRVKCYSCERTHALRPSFLLEHRRDVVAAVGQALLMAAAGAGHRRVAGVVMVPAATARGWLARLREGLWRQRFTALAIELGGGLARPPPSPGLAGLLEALTLAYQAHCDRCGGVDPGGVWGFAACVSAGRLLAAT